MKDRRRDDNSDPNDIRDQAVTCNELRDVHEGDVIALQAVNNYHAITYVASGTVTRTRAFNKNPEEDLEALEEPADQQHNQVPILYFEPETYWSWANNKVIDKSEQLRNRPKVRNPEIDEPQDPPQCTVVYDEKKQLQFFAPEARGGKAGEIYYMMRNLGTIVDLVYGRIVALEKLIPNGCERPS